MHDDSDESTRGHLFLEPVEVLEVIWLHGRPGLDFHTEQIAFTVLDEEIDFTLVGIAVLPYGPPFKIGPNGKFMKDPFYKKSEV